LIMDDDTQLLTPRQVADILGIHQKTVHVWLRSGRLKGTKISYRAWRISRTALDEFIESNSNLSKQSTDSADETPATVKPVKSGDINPGESATYPHNRMKSYLREIMGEQSHEK